MKKETMNRFLGSTKMACEVFKIYIAHVKNDELKKILKEILTTLKHHHQMMEDALEKLSIDPLDSMKVSQLLAVKMEKMKVCTSEDDFAIAIMAIKALNMGIIGALNFLHNNQDLPKTFIQNAKDEIKDYDNLLTKVKSYLSNNIATNED